ncbi:MAG TPA: Tol-Pal system beta propeller repeat protein TolB [Casimicrobiaceae bacterium]|nr:Tol-Pal system beta propeller repeat protein TolB [Casimicrobiaceae bacterium]
MIRTLRCAFALLLAALVLAAAPARAQLTIEIVGGAGTTIPISIVGFENESNWPLGISGVVGADLARSGLFRLIDPTGVVPKPFRAEEVQPAVWRGKTADAVVVGSMKPLPDGRVEVSFALVDVVKQASLASVSFTVTPQQFRATAHKIADIVYEKLTGDAGVFSTRIAYITKQGSRFQLLVADADGFDPQSIVSSNEPLLSPRWSPDGTRLAYVSFEQRKPVVYVQNLDTGERRAVANFRGSNSSPAWSPDGRRLAVTLSKDGSSQVYIMNADGGSATRVLSSPSIDTEAWFTPDGGSLLFTSDRGGTPQIYRANLASGAVERLTFEGSYNVSARPMPDGKGFAYVRRDGGRYQIAIMDLATRQTQVLTSGPDDESPSVAPNGRMIIYANESSGGHGILNAVSSDGRVKQRLVAPATDVREPAWGPLPRS